MAIDEMLGRACDEGGPPTLRFYGWSRPTLSIGRHQRLERAADPVACERLGVDLVRRPSGGRAVLHEQELTYAIALPESEPVLEHGFRAALARIADAITTGLRRIGVPARRADATRPHLSGAVSPCFASCCRDEILVGGLKVAAAAQWRLRAALLQHGSIPLRLDAEQLRELTRWRQPARLSASVFTGLSPWLAGAETPRPRQEPGPARPTRLIRLLRDSIMRGIEEGLGVHLNEAMLGARELERARQLETSVYRSRSWTWRC